MIVGLALLVVAVNPVQPEPGPQRVTVDGNVLAWGHYVDWNEGDGLTGGDFELIGAGTGANLFSLPATLVAGGSGANLGVGYGRVVRDRVVVGARLGLGWQRLFVRSEGVAFNVISYAVTPFVEYAFMPGHRVRPFALVRVGFGGGLGIDRSETSTDYRSIFGPSAGGGGGVHVFVLPRATLDVGATFDYAWAYASAGSDAGAPSGPARFSHQFVLAGTLGGSFWF